MIESEFPHRWYIHLAPDDSPDGPVRLAEGWAGNLLNNVRVAALKLYFENAGFNTVPLPLIKRGFIARHTSPHAMLMVELTREKISIPFTVTEL
jgi:hypothetical protein